MADKSHGNTVDLETGERLDALQSAMSEMDQMVAEISDPANTTFVAGPVAEADMEDGIVYIWPDADGNLVVGGLNSTDGTRELINLEVSAGSDGGIVGGIVGGLL